MNATWLTLTGNAEDGKKMVDMTNEMAQAAANSTEMVDNFERAVMNYRPMLDGERFMTDKELCARLQLSRKKKKNGNKKFKCIHMNASLVLFIDRMVTNCLGRHISKSQEDCQLMIL